MSDLALEFEKELRNAAIICLRECNYRPSYFMQMLEERGGVSTARALLSKEKPSDGFVKLLTEYFRPELTVEHFVSSDKFSGLFTPDEVAKAKRWLGRS
jgi:hypothetical protein